MHNATEYRRLTLTLAVVVGVAICAREGHGQAKAKPSICIVVHGSHATPASIAAGELSAGLAGLYPNESFTVSRATAADAAGHVIHLGTPAALEDVAGAAVAAKRLRGPESYVVTTAKIGGKTVGLVVGADQRGVVNGVCGLLRKLGYGYLLDGDIKPAPRAEPLSFAGWDLADHPLAGRRFVFNWHNFLSGCSSWDLQQWNQWTTQSQKMGYNGIMVHAYGNNPMAGFALKGADKSVGYLSSTRIGRDWATMHVNDVRRLIGGEAFDAPVLGSAAAVDGTDRRRTEAAQKLMAKVFAHAEQRGVDVIFAVDMDTTTANPQSLITRLPQSARFKSTVGGDFWLPRPDTPEGYGYYKAQLAHLLKVYPRIDTFVMWFRIRGTPLISLKVEALPADWQEEYKAIIAREPEVAKYWHSVGIFALGKVAAAHRKALDELGRQDVSLGVGSWGFALQDAADRFLPKDVGLYPLDFEVLWKESRLESPGGPEGVARAAEHRPVYPILWAHHDDRTYVGPPYPPLANFHDLLAKSRCDTSGYGIIHWTTRPLDVFFAGLSDSVWASTRNQSVKATCRRAAGEMLGAEHAKIFGDYLRQWLAGLPMIGRDTSDRFIDRELKGYDEALQSHKQRMALLDSLDQAGLTPIRRSRIAYFRGLERFILSVFENESHYRQAMKLQKEGDISGARKALGRSDVPAAIRLYADTARLLGISRGEQGLIVSLNLRWHTHYLRLAQQLGAEPIRINFAPTSHDPLAQNRGRFTYFVDRDDRFWDVRGEEETKAPAWGQPAGYVARPPAKYDAKWEVSQSGLESDQPISLRVTPIMGGRNATVAPGRYRLTLLLPKRSGAKRGPQVFDAAVLVPGRKEPMTERITLGDSSLARTFDLELAKPGVVQVTLTPVEGKARISGLTLDPSR